MYDALIILGYTILFTILFTVAFVSICFGIAAICASIKWTVITLRRQANTPVTRKTLKSATDRQIKKEIRNVRSAELRKTDGRYESKFPAPNERRSSRWGGGDLSTRRPSNS